ncbi:hypothetical protein EJD97_014647 [Solanum chilense]|uniref:Uncharacterized protein n=1 Tax=Solanum chilense TaxID=4083 RepID=A0A6N2B8N8_SOLCI|nr:hypothetical protein EJD97_014647 [Solanum chilense]
MEDGMSDIANFGFSNSGEDQELEETNQENVGEMRNGKEGGVINNLISNLMSPRAGEPKNKERNDLFEASDTEKSVDESNGSGGIINNLISNIFHPTNENSAENQEIEKVEMKKTEEESGSVLDNIMSHLPTPLAHDAVPATDEASILIHSIVHD